MKLLLRFPGLILFYQEISDRSAAARETEAILRDKRADCRPAQHT
jgi:hypothetical protein